MQRHALLWLLLLFPDIFCAVVNVTIDDSDPLIEFLPLGAWNARSATAPCPGCTANPDTNNVFDGTFHDGTFNSVAGSNDSPNVPLTASVSFNGTAVYVICVLAESMTGPDGNSDMTFFIDGTQVGSFVKLAPGNNNTYDYDVPVISVDSLTFGQHNLTIQNGHVNGSKSLMLLDQIVYSVDTESASTLSQSTATSSSASSTTSSNVTGSPSIDSSSKKNIGSTVGPAVAVPVAVLLLAALGICIFLRRHKRQHFRSKQHLTIDPFASEGTSAASGSQQSMVAHKPGSGTGSTRSDPAVVTNSVQIARDEPVSIPNEAPPAYDWPASRNSRKGFRNGTYR